VSRVGFHFAAAADRRGKLQKSQLVNNCISGSVAKAVFRLQFLRLKKCGRHTASAPGGKPANQDAMTARRLVVVTLARRRLRIPDLRLLRSGAAHF